jgi:hypothetical protein
MQSQNADRGLLYILVDDGRPLLMLTSVILFLSGVFALFLSATNEFLPHDVAYLGMTAKDLCAIDQCRIVHFMIHDRVSFGGTLTAIATLYTWLVQVPLRNGETWAWWTLLVSAVVGFGSFLLYLGYGYIDQWHGVATLILLPCFATGMVLTAKKLRAAGSLRPSFKPATPVSLKHTRGIGRSLLLLTAASLCLGGLIIMGVGVTTVFVPQDLEFMGLRVADIEAVNPRLVPLIAHDRAGFGGGVCCTGITMLLCIWRGRPSRSLWQTVLVSGLAGFATAIGIHPVIGYTSLTHLAPAYLGAAMFLVGIGLNCPSNASKRSAPTEIIPPIG